MDLRDPRPASADPPRGELSTLAEQVRSAGGPDSLSLRAWLDLAERWRILRALERARGNRSAAARSLGIGRRTLYTKMEKFGIEPRWRARDPAAPGGG